MKRPYRTSVTAAERARREAARDVAEPNRVTRRAQRREAMQEAAAAPTTRELALTPGFVPFAPGRLVGWIVDDVTGCWRWTGRLNHGQAVVHVDGRSVGVIGELMICEHGCPENMSLNQAKGRHVRTCDTPECVNLEHRAWLAPGDTIRDVARRALLESGPTISMNAVGPIGAHVMVPVDDLRAILSQMDVMDMYPETGAAYERIRMLMPEPGLLGEFVPR